MKDIIITRQRQKKELISLAVCFVIGMALNIYAVIKYEASWTEIFTSIGFVMLTTAILYAAWTILRLILLAIKTITNK